VSSGRYSSQNGAEASAPSLTGRIFDRVLVIFGLVGTCWIVFIALMVNADVLSRALLNKSIAGVPEVISVSIVAIVFLQAAFTLKSGRFIRSDALISRIRVTHKKRYYLIELFNDFAGFVAMGILLFSSWILMVRSYQKGEFIGEYGHFTMIIWPIKMVITAGTMLLLIQYARRITMDLRALSSQDSGTKS